MGVWNFEFFDFFEFFELFSLCFPLISFNSLLFSFESKGNSFSLPPQMPGLRTWGRQGPGGGSGILNFLNFLNFLNYFHCVFL